MPSIPASLCVRCKGGRNLCGLGYCPLLSRVELKPKLQQQLNTEYQGPSTSIFVGRFGYPKVNVGPLTALETQDLSILDSPQKWFGMPYEKIVELRSLMMRSHDSQHIKARSRFSEDNKLLAIAERPTDVELQFKKKPDVKFSFSDVHQPMGPTALLREMTIVENVKVSRTVEKVINDELRASESIKIMYEKNEDVYKIMTILSSGTLGVGERKKLVPTRWSITAVDDTVSKQLLQEVRTYPSINEYRVYESQFLYNRLCVLLMPGAWEYEAFESWAPGSFWASASSTPYMIEEYEPHNGRKDYASDMGGCYYSTRLAVAEHLSAERRQARCIAFREVDDGYVIPVGVWQVRENVRNAMRQPYKKFTTLNEALAYVWTKMKITAEEYKKRSVILSQKKLFDFTSPQKLSV